ncbi:unnamed protein product [Cyprideis torosa]|uniref:Uncharacterized protein n=1 Tax=Cyprideis torosa TaxID=163714 RepID=A0A7R8ZN79_9CRUS|nr:unnamed protein product [Cyprideis torosa]CAG0887282.1 unnamed protein product [Cyprideis torosa]
MKVFVFAFLGVVLCHSDDAARKHSEETPEYLSPSEFIEGDIKLPSGFDRAAMNFQTYPSRKWPSNTVPYVISSSFSAGHMLDELVDNKICLWVTAALLDWVPQSMSSCTPLDFGTSKVAPIEMTMSQFIGTR